MFSFVKDVALFLYGIKKSLDLSELSYQKLNDDGAVAYTLRMDQDGK